MRELGVALGLPHDMVYRHPFPGPGLGVRILGEVKPEYADLLRRADAIFIDELRAGTTQPAGKSWYDLTSQAFAVFLPVKSVGVMGDGRTYDYVVALRAVQTSDFMTADWAELPYALLKKVELAHHQRGARHQPRHLRRIEQAAGDDRVGVAIGACSLRATARCVTWRWPPPSQGRTTRRGASPRPRSSPDRSDAAAGAAR